LGIAFCEFCDRHRSIVCPPQTTNPYPKCFEGFEATEEQDATEVLEMLGALEACMLHMLCCYCMLHARQRSTAHGFCFFKHLFPIIFPIFQTYLGIPSHKMRRTRSSARNAASCKNDGLTCWPWAFKTPTKRTRTSLVAPLHPSRDDEITGARRLDCSFTMGWPKRPILMVCMR